ncbi:MAG: aldose 1-epimerase [Thermoplasmata archaeon]
MLEIGCENSRAGIDTLGAYLSSLTIGSTVVLMESEDGHQTHGGCAVLSPFANRIRNAEYVFEGKRYSLPKNSGEHSIHGLLRDLRWNVEKSENNRVAVLSTVLRHPGYPSELYSKLTYSISENSFSVDYVALNSGSANCPVLIGFHPYFMTGKKWKLDYRGKVTKLLYMDQYFPSGETEPADLRSENLHLSKLDNCFHFDGDLRLISDNGTFLIKRSNMPYLVIYNGTYAGNDSVAIEPMTGAPDAYNNGIGLLKLRPGESFSCGFEITVEQEMTGSL